MVLNCADSWNETEHQPVALHSDMHQRCSVLHPEEEKWWRHTATSTSVNVKPLVALLCGLLEGTNRHVPSPPVRHARIRRTPSCTCCKVALHSQTQRYDTQLSCDLKYAFTHKIRPFTCLIELQILFFFFFSFSYSHRLLRMLSLELRLLLLHCNPLTFSTTPGLL